jgi:hypothetical protein
VDLLYLPRFLIVNHLRCLPLTTRADSSRSFLLGAHEAIATDRQKLHSPIKTLGRLRNCDIIKKAFLIGYTV